MTPIKSIRNGPGLLRNGVILSILNHLTRLSNSKRLLNRLVIDGNRSHSVDRTNHFRRHTYLLIQVNDVIHCNVLADLRPRRNVCNVMNYLDVMTQSISDIIVGVFLRHRGRLISICTLPYISVRRHRTRHLSVTRQVNPYPANADNNRYLKLSRARQDLTAQHSVGKRIVMCRSIKSSDGLQQDLVNRGLLVRIIVRHVTRRAVISHRRLWLVTTRTVLNVLDVMKIRRRYLLCHETSVLRVRLRLVHIERRVRHYAHNALNQYYIILMGFRLRVTVLCILRIVLLNATYRTYCRARRRHRENSTGSVLRLVLCVRR